jgi:carboxylate-amine ligase
MDVSPRLCDTLALAALVQAIVRMLSRLRATNMRWREYDRFLIAENRWRAQRYGVDEGLIDFGDRSIKPQSQLLDELLEIVDLDTEALGTRAQMDRLREIAANGTSATRQRRVFAQAQEDGRDPGRAVVDHLIEEFHADL